MKKHTTIDLDMVLVGEAAIALETKKVSETVHAALKEVVDARRRLRLLELDPDLTLREPWPPTGVADSSPTRPKAR